LRKRSSPSDGRLEKADADGAKNQEPENLTLRNFLRRVRFFIGSSSAL
jgi:hypothetical protein